MRSFETDICICFFVFVGKELADLLLSMKDEMTYVAGRLVSQQVIQKLNAVLRPYGIAVTYSILQKQQKLQFEVGYTKEDMYNEFKRTNTVRKFATSSLEVVHNGILDSDFDPNEMMNRAAPSIKHHIYLVAQPLPNSLNVGFVPKIEDFYSVFVPSKARADAKKRKMQKVNGICPKCHSLFKASARYKVHVSTCTGKQ